MPVLVDTSIWSLLLRRDQHGLSSSERRVVEVLRDLVAEKRVRVIGPIRQEILSGIRETAQFERLKHRFRDFEDELLSGVDYEIAAEINCKCRSVGVAVSSIDCLICAVAVSRGWEVFTRDQDFKCYAQVTSLRLFALP